MVTATVVEVVVMVVVVGEAATVEEEVVVDGAEAEVVATRCQTWVAVLEPSTGPPLISQCLRRTSTSRTSV